MATASRDILRRVALGALVLAGCTPGSATGKQPVPPAAAVHARPGARRTGLEGAVLDGVNRHRRARGLAPLAPDARIAHEARLHSAAMAAGKTSVGHAGFQDRVAALHEVRTFRRIAENVAFNSGHRAPAAEAVRGWLSSRGHRQNIEGPYERTGIGVVSNAKGEVYFTQIFVGR